MMRPFSKSTFVGGCFVAYLLMALASPALGQVLAQSGDIAGYVGYGDGNYSTSGVGATNNHIEYGGSGGYNVTPNVTVLGEYSLMPMGTYSGVTFKTQLYGGGARFNFSASGRAVPYVAVSVGGNRFTGAESGVSVSANGYYVGFGAGASIYLGRHWGVRPEFRYERQSISFGGITAGTNVILGSGSIFFQFGGQGIKKSKSAQQ